MPAFGDYVIVRSREQGCMLGTYAGGSGRHVILSDARQIYSWGGNRLTLVDLARRGPEGALLRLSVSTESGQVEMLEACGILPVAAAHVEAFKSHRADES